MEQEQLYYDFYLCHAVVADELEAEQHVQQAIPQMIVDHGQGQGQLYYDFCLYLYHAAATEGLEPEQHIEQPIDHMVLEQEGLA